MKKLLSVILITLAVLSLFAGCGAQQTDVKIGLAAPDETHGWVAGVSYYAQKFCEDEGIEYDLTTSADAAEMEKNLSALAERGAEAVVIWPQWSGMEPAVKSLVDKGLPVVSFDVEIDCDGVYKVTGNNYDMGYQCAKYIVGQVGEAASVAVMDVPSAGSVSALRKQGFYDALKEIGYNTENIFEIKEDSFSRESGYADMKAVLAAHPHVDAVFSMDDEISIGVVQAITESGRTDIKAVTGGGGMQEYFNMIADAKYESLGLVSALYSPSMVEEAIRTAIKLASGESSSKVVVIPTTIVTKENIQDYLDPQNTVY